MAASGQRWVLHVDMDSFFASCEQLTRPTLRGRPVLVAGLSGRGVVAGASYEARAYGVHSAMPTSVATRIIGYPAVVVAPRRAVYSTASRRVFGLIADRVDVVEQLSIDEAFLEPADLQGAPAPEVTRWAEALRAVIHEETGLTASIGAGTGKQYAKIGSGAAKPDGVCVVPEAKQLRFLHPLPVGSLWGVGPVTEAKLRSRAVETIGDLAALTRREAEMLLGAAVGAQLWELARGVDNRPVHPRAEAKSVSAEHTYPQDLTTRAEMDDALDRAAHDAHRRLLRDGRGARTVTVKLKMADFRIESRSVTLGYATEDYEALRATVDRLARYPDEVGPVRLVGVGFSGLETTLQRVLFPELERQIFVEDPDNDFEVGVVGGPADDVTVEVEQEPTSQWRPSDDVSHPAFGHGWVQGAGHGIVTVRFETRTTGPGRARTFPEDDPALRHADPVDSLDWHEWLDSTNV